MVLKPRFARASSLCIGTLAVFVSCLLLSPRVDAQTVVQPQDLQFKRKNVETASRPGTWSEWESLGEHLASAPSAVSGGDGHLAVFFRGTDGHLRSVWWGGGLWHLGRDIGAIVMPEIKMSDAEKIARALKDRLKNALDWEDGSSTEDPDEAGEGPWAAPTARAVGDTLYYKGGNRIPVNSAPGCVMKAPRHIDCFVLDYAGRVWHRWYRGNEGWDRWQIMNRGSERMSSTPTASSSGEDRIDLYARGADGQLMHQSWDGKTWGRWVDRGFIEIEGDSLSMEAELRSASSCISPETDRTECFVRGPGDQLFQRRFSRRSTGTWRNLGGALTSAPSATYWESGRIDVFARGTEDQLIHTFWDGRQWWPWESLGGKLDSAPSCVARHGVIDCFAQGSHPSTGTTDVLLHRWMVLPQ
jgi:hypothetical protein